MSKQARKSEVPAIQNVFSELDPLRDFFEQPLRLTRFFDRPQGGAIASAGGWAPALDINETKDGYVVSIELPGTRKEDISVECQDNLLTIRGQKKSEREGHEGAHVHYTERTFGSFSRTVRLPADSTGDAKASFRDGVLTIDIPKTEERKPRSVAIES
jgi:HSP20 family protein